MPLPPDNTAIITALKKGKVTVKGRFLNSSNFTFWGFVQYQDLEVEIVYKPERGERPLWDFEQGSLAKRETAAYLVSKTIGWHLVPPTCLRKRLPAGPGSIQLFIPHDPESHYFNMTEGDKQKLTPMVLFDYIVNNADRKGGHIFLDESGKIWGIDHGLCFHPEEKLRSVIWDFSGKTISAELQNDIGEFIGLFEQKNSFTKELAKYLQPLEIEMVKFRAQQLLNNPVFPLPAANRRPYPWPPI